MLLNSIGALQIGGAENERLRRYDKHSELKIRRKS